MDWKIAGRKLSNIITMQISNKDLQQKIGKSYQI